MTVGCKQNWCVGLTAMASVSALLISIYTLRVISIDQRMSKVESRGETILELSIDMKYIKVAVQEIKQAIDTRNHKSISSN